MSTLTHTGSHPVLACVDAIGAALDEVAGVEPVFMTTRRNRPPSSSSPGCPSRVESLKLRVLAAADDIAVETGARSTAAWLADTTRDHHGTVLRSARLAVAVDERYRIVGAALAEGRVNVAQAHVIVAALEDLPPTLDPDLRIRGEEHLVEQAAQFGPRELRRLGDRLLEAIAPDIADRAEYERLVAEERRAHAATRLTFRPRGDGSTDLFARIPDHVANRLRTYLDAFTSPRRAALDTALGEVDGLPVARRRGEAFCALLENLPDAGLPRHGGTATHVMVTLDYDTLLNDAGVATTSTGDRITAGHASLSEPANTRNSTPGRDRPPTPRAGAAGRKRAWPRRPPTVATHVDAARPTRRPSPAAPARGDGQRTRPKPRAAELHHHRAHDPGWAVHHHPNGTTTLTKRT